MTISIVRLYHDLMGTYGDQGNAEVLIHRAKARGLDCELVEVTPHMPVPTSGDIYLIGGGEDGPQTASLRMLQKDGGLSVAIDRGASLFAVCAGFQIIGRQLPNPDGGMIEGLGLLDAITIVDESPRSVGELVIEPSQPELPVFTGFENHQGLTELGPEVRPLGKVSSGIGNGFDGLEGAWQGNIIATYMHGPALARNPELADVVLKGVVGELTPYDDDFANELARERRATLATK